MTYPMLVEDHHKQTYADNVVMVAQQMRNPLMAAVTEKPVTGDAHRVADIFGKAKYNKRSGNRNNPENAPDRTARWVVCPDEPIDAGDYIEKMDVFRTAYDPTSTYVASFTAAVTRGWMHSILGVEQVAEGLFKVGGGGILGLAREGKTPGVGTPLPASQIVPHGNAKLTLGKLRDAVKALKKADFGMDKELDPLYCAITPEDEDALLEIAAQTGQNLNAFQVQQLQTGTPTSLLGINWLMTNDLPLTAAEKRLLPLWSKANIGVGVWQPIKGETWNDPSRKNMPYAYVSAVVDAVRIQDKGVIAIEVNPD